MGVRREPSSGVVAAWLSVRHLGRTRYEDVLALQRVLHDQRKAGLCGDTLLLTEHEPVLTLGRGASISNLRVPEARLAAIGIAVVPVERGGDVTFHGPGQLVAYPILDLRRYGRDVHAYVRALEESVLRLLTAYGISGERRPGTPGVWVGEDKIASVGIFVSRWVTLHGIAINIDPDLAYFDLIHPCGLVGQRMTSMRRVLGRPVEMASAVESYVAALRAVLSERAHTATREP